MNDDDVDVDVDVNVDEGGSPDMKCDMTQEMSARDEGAVGYMCTSTCAYAYMCINMYVHVRVP